RITPPTNGSTSPRARARKSAASRRPPRRGNDGHRAARAALRGVARAQAPALLRRSPQREFLRRRRRAARLARALSRSLSPEPSRRRTLARLGRCARRRAPRAPRAARAPLRSRLRLGALVLVVDRRAPRERPLAPSVHRGGARSRGGADRRGAGAARS